MIGNLRVEVAVSMERGPVYSQQTHTDRGHTTVLTGSDECANFEKARSRLSNADGRESFTSRLQRLPMPRYAATGGRYVADYFGIRSADVRRRLAHIGNIVNKISNTVIVGVCCNASKLALYAPVGSSRTARYCKRWAIPRIMSRSYCDCFLH